MAAPPEIPAEVLEVLRAQAAALAKVSGGQKAKLLALSREVVADLEAALRRLAPSKFTTQETRVKLAQVRAIVDILGAELGERIGNEVQALGALAARIGRDGLIEQIAAWAGKFPGSVRRISPAELAGDVLDRGLLEYYETSRQTYGMEAIAKMRGALSLGVLNGQTIQQTTEALAAAVEISEGRAERIVRTESSFAAHRRQVLDAREADLGLAKMLISTFDNRTGQDSVFVHEQVRELDEPFSDNEGRVYQHPPNRPNDRETVVFVPSTLNDLGPPAEDDTGKADQVPVRPAPVLVPRGSAEADPRLAAEGALSPRVAMVGPKGKPGEIFGPDEAGAMASTARTWARDLPSDEAEAVSKWTTGWRPIRRAWADGAAGRNFEQGHFDVAVRLVSALNKAPRWRGEVFRGVATDLLLDDATGKPVSLEAGAIFSVGRLRAFSLQKDAAVGFASPVEDELPGLLLQVTKGPRKGIPYIAAAADPKYVRQHECLTMEGVRFRILKVHELEVMERIENSRLRKLSFRRVEIEAP